ncbi:hypothetical protein ASF60_21725 [Methylobacterium sp. Leaf113]|uniref:hypothetical protein n=1 Tax=Methylobacterium sp. Leaf113 TaxID=1736259 RepID=UPI0006F7EE5E|nr:hypothetical protein [Methylobacterium sp. Leaf113]KQP85380.1 hypothetical protein ASF60_21725 [Methylobacterium sp. Leaf113]
MADFEHTLQRFQSLMLAEQPVDVGEAEDAIWAYLAQAQGLSAQIGALDRLQAAVTRWDNRSVFLPQLRAALDRHRARLAEPSA